MKTTIVAVVLSVIFCIFFGAAQIAYMITDNKELVKTLLNLSFIFGLPTIIAIFATFKKKF